MNLQKSDILGFRSYARSYPSEEVIVGFELDLKPGIELKKEDIDLRYHAMAGKVTHFDPKLGKNVTEVWDGSQTFPVRILSFSMAGNTAKITCCRLATMVEFDLKLGGTELHKSDATLIDPEVDCYEKHTYDKNGTKFGYRLFVPKLKAGEKVPVVLSLHGSGDVADRTNNDSRAPVAESRLGLTFSAETWQKDHPCYVVTPQYPSLQESYQSKKYQDAYVDIIGELVKNGQADPNRIYCTTLSMGSRIVYSMLENYPDYFAGMLIHCGNPDKAVLTQVKKTPITIVHMETDGFIPAYFGKQTFELFNRMGNRNVRLILYPACYKEMYHLFDAHCSWVMSMEEIGNRNWLFAQNRGEPGLSADARPVFTINYLEVRPDYIVKNGIFYFNVDELANYLTADVYEKTADLPADAVICDGDRKFVKYDVVTQQLNLRLGISYTE